MKPVWDILLFSLLSYYIILIPHPVIEEQEPDSIHNALIHNHYKSLLSLIFSTLSRPIFYFSTIQVTLLYLRTLLLTAFFLTTRSLTKTISKIYGEDIAISYYLLIALQSRVTINSSRFLLSNYGFILGSVAFEWFLQGKRKAAGWICTFCLVWNFMLELDVYVISEPSFKNEEFPIGLIVLIVAGSLSLRPKNSIVDARMKKILIFAFLSFLATFHIHSMFYALPALTLLSARGLSRL